MNKETSNIYAFRLEPGEDLNVGMERVVPDKDIRAGRIATCLGSLTGTLSVNGSHFHICISDSSGTMISGHLMPGCKYTRPPRS